MLLVGRQERHPACKKTEQWGAGMVICLERGADLHMAQQMPLPLTVSCFSKIQIGFTFLVPAHPGIPGQRAVKRVCVCCVCVNAQVHLLINYTRILLRQALSVGMYRVAQKVAKLSMQTFQIKSNGLGCTFYVAAKNSLQISSVLLYPRNAVSNSSADDTSATAMSNITQY